METKNNFHMLTMSEIERQFIMSKIANIERLQKNNLIYGRTIFDHCHITIRLPFSLAYIATHEEGKKKVREMIKRYDEEMKREGKKLLNFNIDMLTK